MKSKSKQKTKENIKKADYLEWEAALFGGCFVAFGVGAVLSQYFNAFLIWVIVIGFILHGWGMYKISQRNK